MNTNKETPRTVVVVVSPSMAEIWLRTIFHQRRLRPHVVQKYANDMTAGRWTFTHQGLCFDDANRLIDGQHRLSAIILAAKTNPDIRIAFVVTYGVPEASAQSFDIGLGRRLSDAAIYAGFGNISASTLAIARYMRCGWSCNTGKTSNAEMLDFYRQHEPAIATAARCLPDKVAKLCVAPVRAVFARAYYTEKTEQLLRAGRILTHGVSEDGTRRLEDATLQVLCRALLVVRGGGRDSREEQYRKTSRCLRAYLDGEMLTKAYAAADELFHLPEDDNLSPSR